MEPTEYKKNILIFSLFYISSRILLFTPISMLFYMEYGLKISDITLIKSLTFLTVIILEVPSGALSDLISRKCSIIISIVFFSLSCFIIAFSSSYQLFLVAGVCWGAGMAFISGSDVSWLYDYLLRYKEEKKFTEISGRLTMINKVVTAISLTFSSVLFTTNHTFPYLLNGIIFLISLIFASLLDVDREKVKKKHITFKKYVSQLNSGLKNILLDDKIKSILLYNLIFMSFTIFMFDTYQMHLSELGFNTSFIGVLYATFMLLSGFASNYTYKIKYNNSNNMSFLLMLVILQGLLSIALFLASGKLVIIILIFAFQEILFGIYIISSSKTLNDSVKSASRATILSYSSFLNNLCKSIMFPIAGLGVDNFGLTKMYLIIGGVIILLSIIVRLTTMRNIWDVYS